MPWVRFTGDFDWKPMASVTLAYRRGDHCNVTRGCAAAALAAGKAEKAERLDGKARSGRAAGAAGVSAPDNQ